MEKKERNFICLQKATETKKLKSQKILKLIRLSSSIAEREMRKAMCNIEKY